MVHPRHRANLGEERRLLRPEDRKRPRQTEANGKRKLKVLRRGIRPAGERERTRTGKKPQLAVPSPVRNPPKTSPAKFPSVWDFVPMWVKLVGAWLVYKELTRGRR